MIIDENVKYEKINNSVFVQPKAEGYLHSQVMTNLFYEIQKNLKGISCYVSAGNFNLFLSGDEWTVPDIMLFCEKDKIKKYGYKGVPSFVAEIISPYTESKDRNIKLRTYAQYGIGEYWIVDPPKRKLEIYYLQEKNYVLKDTFIINKNESGCNCNSISLKDNPTIHIKLEDIFWGTTSEE